jgi:hypothetical protein
MDSSLMLPSETHLAALGQVVEGIEQVVVVIHHLLGSGGRRRGAFCDSRAPLGYVKAARSVPSISRKMHKTHKTHKTNKTQRPSPPLPPPLSE